MKRFVLAVLATAVFAFGADIDGKWVGKLETPNGSRDVTLKLKADGAKLTGTMSGRQNDSEIQDGKIEGENVSFTVIRNFNGNEIKQNYKGTLKGGELRLQYQMRDNNVELTLRRSES
jgi:hypothetical protein